MPGIRSISAVVAAALPVLTLSPAASHPVRRHADATSVTRAARAPAWRLAVTQHFGQAGNASGYSAIVVTGRRRVWVFGGTNPGGLSAPVAEVWTGHGWRRSRLPAGLSGFISAVSAPSAADMWAISGYGCYLLHWNGTRWSVARRWNQQGELSGVTAVGRRDVWVFGTSAAGVRSIGTWHFTGGAWAAVRGAAADIYRASALSSRDIWAIAAAGRRDYIERFGGRTWRRVRTPRSLTRIRWHDILAVSKNDVWVLGNAASRGSGPGRLELVNWNGVRWVRYIARTSAWALQLAAGPDGAVLATGTTGGSQPSGMIVQVTSHGRLTLARIGSGLGSGVSDAAFVPGARAVWASGGILTLLGSDAAIWVQPAPRTAARSVPRTAGRQAD
jgi:hypothetical protein